MIPLKAYAVDDNDNATIVEFSKTMIDKPYDTKRLDTSSPKDQAGWFIEIQNNAAGKAIKKD